ncbi:MAG: hypothetical protein HQ558_05185 [Candidatus Omnitrophica bacterium]|nr:hypothetical protein [Candidatus Omnitrophota bacterium]
MKLLRSVLLNNISIKIISLVLAILTWVYIAGQLYRADLAQKKEAPSIIKVSGKKLIVKRLPIYVNIEGEPVKGYKVALDKIVVSPSHSVVAGPPDVIKDISYITTKPIDISKVNSNIRKRIGLMNIKDCKIGYEDLVNITVPIVRERRR